MPVKTCSACGNMIIDPSRQCTSCGAIPDPEQPPAATPPEMAAGSGENLESEWVRYEWSSFLNDMRGGFKLNSEVYVLYRGMKIADLPRALRQQQAFNAGDSESFDKICNFIQNALVHNGYAHSPPAAKDALGAKLEDSRPETPAIKPSALQTAQKCRHRAHKLNFI